MRNQNETNTPPHGISPHPSWDALYATEIANHAANPTDEGTVWFDDSDAQEKMVSFLDDFETDGAMGMERVSARVLDLGCGNGSLLFALRDDGWTGRLWGVDYSAESVRLARRVREARRAQREEEEGKEDGETREVDFCEWDVLNGPFDENTIPAGGWDLVLDKGTFDAVSLSGERDGHGRRICEGYGERVVQLLRNGGKFLVTSCNWTEPELKVWFEGTNKGEGKGRLRQVGRIDYPSFSFGGVKGQTISSLCFEKVDG